MAQLITDIYYLPVEANFIYTVCFLMCWTKFTVRNQESFCPGSFMYAVISAGTGIVLCSRTNQLYGASVL